MEPPQGSASQAVILAIKAYVDEVESILKNTTYGLSSSNTYIWDKNISAYTGNKAGTYLKSLYDKIPSKSYLMGSADSDGGFDSEAKADINAEVDGAFNTTIPGTNVYDSINDILLDQIKPRLPGSGTISTHTAVNVRKSVCLTGDPASSIGKALYEIYVNRLTATRAGYLDQLDFDLNARLGSPTGASISADIIAIKSELDNATYGLSAIETLVDDIESRLGTPAAGTVAGDTESIETKVGTNTDAVGTTTLFARLRQIVDTYLSDATIGLAAIEAYVDCLPATLGDLPTKNLAHILSDSTAFAGADISAIKALIDTAEDVGPFSYLDAGAEQTVKEDTAVTRRHIHLEVSNRNMTQTGTFKIYRKVDGTNYDLYTSQAVKVAAGSDRAWDASFTTNQPWKLTYTEDADEGAARAIPYNVITEVKE